MISQIARLLGGLNSRIRRLHVKYALEGRLNRQINDFEEETTGVTPHGISIQWVSEDTRRESFLQGNSVVCRMQYDSNPHRNYLNAALLYVKSGFVPHARLYLDTKLRHAVDLVAVGKIVSRSGDRGARQEYYESVLPSQLQADKDIDDHYETLINIENYGYYSKIFLPEIVDYSMKIGGLPPRRRHQDETLRFCLFLKGLAEAADTRTTARLDFMDTNIKIHVVYVGIREKLNKRGVQPWVDALRYCRDHGVHTVYMSGMGHSCAAIPMICDVAVADGLCTVVDKRDYTVSFAGGGTVKAGLVRLECKS